MPSRVNKTEENSQLKMTKYETREAESRVQGACLLPGLRGRATYGRLRVKPSVT